MARCRAIGPRPIFKPHQAAASPHHLLAIGHQSFSIEVVSWVQRPRFDPPIVKDKGVRALVEAKRDEVGPVGTASNSVLDREIDALDRYGAALEWVAAVARYASVEWSEDHVIIASNKSVLVCRQPLKYPK